MRYEFNCASCGIFEIIIPHTELDNIKECPRCDCKDIERVYSPLNSVWKCGGNYGKSS